MRNGNVYEDAKKLRAAIEAVARDIVRRETRDCFRVKKAKVTTAPNGTVCGVQLAGDDTELFLPYVSSLSTVQVGNVVWVAVLGGDSMRNAIVWQNATLSAGGGASYEYTETPNSAGGTTIEITG